ncbi:hypothetical protein KY289_000605 [Solanum tuberosum]|nr:hypothetical protein KY289_000605 [Solanum tuberosum]
MLLHITPFFTLWEIGKTRNAKRWLFSKEYIRMDIKWGWRTKCSIAKNYKPRITSIVVYWTRPQWNIWKLNIDSSFIPGQRLAGIGEIVRKKNGKMATLHGIEWCHDNSSSHIILKMDSQIAVI